MSGVDPRGMDTAAVLLNVHVVLKSQLEPAAKVYWMMAALSVHEMSAGTASPGAVAVATSGAYAYRE